MDTLIIGCGAAGVAAAIAAAEQGEQVTVIERNRKPLKKLGVTGNGRGNLLNCGQLRYYGDTAFAHQVLEKMPYAQVKAFLESCGLTLTEEDEGRIYPAAYQASVAVDALLSRMEQLGIRIVCGAQATAIRHCGDQFVVDAVTTEYAPDFVKPNGKVKKGEALRQWETAFSARRVIVTAGGAAAPVHGTDGSIYSLLTALGHHLIPPRPALCALVTAKTPLQGLSGQRVRAQLTLVAAHGAVLAKSRGEALFADDGVSGIAAMQLARFVEPGCVLHMDLREGLLGDAHGDALAILTSRLERLGGTATPTQLLIGCANAALQAALCRMAGIDRSLPVDEKALCALAAVLADYAIPVAGTRDFDQAQVTAGGLDAAQFDPSTMESRLVPGLYAAGEVLDVDGDCGGYNLMFAFAGGLLAGKAGR